MLVRSMICGYFAFMSQGQITQGGVGCASYHSIQANIHLLFQISDWPLLNRRLYHPRVIYVALSVLQFFIIVMHIPMLELFVIRFHSVLSAIAIAGR